MSSRRRNARKSAPSAASARHGGTSVPDGTGTLPWRVSAREWLLRLALAVGAPLLLFVLLEAGLRVFGFGYPVSFFVRSAAGERYITNEKFAWQFSSRETPLKPFLGSVPLVKAPGTIRVCVLGESAAMGTPDPAFGVSRILEVLLRREFPERRFEVINAAMRGINSHALRLIARECAQHQVDVFLVYMGNNEVIGLHGPTPSTPPWGQSLTLIRCSRWFAATRLGQLMERLLGGGKARENQDMDYFRAQSLRPDDARREKNRKNFRANLEDILRETTRSGAKVVLSTVAANLKDFPPLQSLHRADLSAADLVRWDAAVKSGAELAGRREWQEAIKQFSVALDIDDHFAELHFRLAEALLAAGDAANAKQHFRLALDWDALQLRTDSRMNRVIREAAGNYADRGVSLLDAEETFANSGLCQHELPGKELFEDHVHPTFAGNYLLAWGFYASVVSAIGPSLGTPSPAVLPTESECADALAYTLYDQVNVTAAMVRMTGSPPFLDQLHHAERQAAAEGASRASLAAFRTEQAERCLATYLAAIRQRPDDWVIRYNLAVFCKELGRHTEAARELRLVVKEFPEIKRFRIALASELQLTGEKADLAVQLREALRLDPRDAEVAQALRQVTGNAHVK